MAKNESLHKAKAEKNDEFYTQFSDIERECGHYTGHFKGKTVFCNCDDPFTSEFFKYFAVYFNELELKRLIAASYDPSPIAGTQLPFDEIAGLKGSDKKAYVFDADEMPNNLDDTKLMMKTVKEVVRPLKGNGDFRSAECVELLKQADIVVTNPPFSLFREYVAQLMEYGKQFLIIGHMNAITYKDIFTLIKENKVWLGFNNGAKTYRVPQYYNQNNTFAGDDGKRYAKMGNTMWFTNLDHKKRHEELELWKKYTPADYPHYDNYDAIEVGKVYDIPVDWTEAMGVPVTFLDKYNPDQFEILGATESEGKGASAGLWKGGIAQAAVNGTRVYKRLFIKCR